MGHKPGGGAVFMSTPQAREQSLNRPPMQAPLYWTPVSRAGRAVHEVIPGTPEELQWMQRLLDGTFKQKVTRDRKGGVLANRFIAVQCLRSEHPVLWDKFAQQRQKVLENCKRRGGADATFEAPKTLTACPGLASRC